MTSPDRGDRRIDWDALRAAADEAGRTAHAPFSELRVGAAGLVDDGRIVTGCNVESASYGLTLCAECGLISALYRTGGGRLVAVSCVAADRGEVLTPCGRCRQLLFEAGGRDVLVDAPDGPLPLGHLLPHAFGSDDL